MDVKEINIYEALRTVPRYRVSAIGMFVLLLLLFALI